MRTHFVERPFRCTVCDHTYATKSALDAHIMGTRRAERPFRCIVCDSNFASKIALDTHIGRHIIIHTGENHLRAHERQNIQTPYTVNNILDNHIEMQTGENPLRTHTAQNIQMPSTSNNSINNRDGQPSITPSAEIKKPKKVEVSIWSKVADNSTVSIDSDCAICQQPIGKQEIELFL